MFLFICFFFVEPILSSDELDVIQYKISSPGSFAFAEGCNNTVSCNGVNTSTMKVIKSLMTMIR